MMDLSVEALKISVYLKEDLFKEASESKFLISACFRSKNFKEHIQVKQMNSSQASNYYYYYHFYYYSQFIFCLS